MALNDEDFRQFISIKTELLKAREKAYFFENQDAASFEQCEELAYLMVLNHENLNYIFYDHYEYWLNSSDAAGAIERLKELDSDDD